MSAKLRLLILGNNALWLIISAYCAYLWIDQSISLTYSNASIESLAEDVDVAQSILNVTLLGKSKKEVRTIVEQSLQSDYARRAREIKDEGDEFWIGQTCIHFVNQTFASFNCPDFSKPTHRKD